MVFPKQLLTPKLVIILSPLILVLLSLSYFYYLQTTKYNIQLEDLKSQKLEVEKELNNFKNEDQVVKNQKLEDEIKNIHQTYLDGVTSYEKILSLSDKKVNTLKMNELFAKSLKYLSDKSYSSASATIAEINKQVKAEEDKLAFSALPSSPDPKTVIASNNPPSSGYSRQAVISPVGTFTVSIISADLGSTRVIVDTASSSDCADNCPVLSLGDYVSRNGAYAGVNGSYFCPSTYPSCAGKANSFDTILMNKNKVYFNSANNVYSTVPAVIFLGSSIRFVGQSLEWGRDTSPDSMIANYPLLVSGSNVVYSGDSDPKHTSRGNRSFVGNKGSTVYIGVVHSASLTESAQALKALGLDNALNLDDGGSTALWSGGYKVGPGRNLPNAILFVRK